MKEIKSLTGLRGFAAILVILFHYTDKLNVLQFQTFLPLYSVRGPIISKGYIFVDLFFLMSGFLLMYAYKSRDLSYRDFLYRRVSRIFPLHHFATLTLVALIAFDLTKPMDASQRYSLSNFFRHFTLTQSWGGSFHGSWNYPAWSLSIEFLLYLLFPLFAIVSKIKKSSVSAVILILYQLIVLLYFGYYLNGHVDNSNGFTFMARGIFQFLNGCLVFIYFRNSKQEELKFSNLWGCSVLVLLFFILKSSLNIAYVFPLFTALLFILIKKQNNYFSFLFSNPVSLHLGKISYSLYIWHIIIYELVGYNTLARDNYDSTLLTLVILYIVSLLTYYLIEVRLRAKILQRLSVLPS